MNGTDQGGAERAAEETALAVVELARQARFAEIEELFAPPLRAVANGDAVRLAWSTELDAAGALREVGPPVAESLRPGLVRVRVPVRCERGGLTVLMSVDPDGRLHGLRLAPLDDGWESPSYADPARFTEREVVLDGGLAPVRGVLTLPRERRFALDRFALGRFALGRFALGRLARGRRQERRPGVVLLSGGGAFDADGTAGPKRPLKDLAWGLASRGVAVLRFDKVSFAHAEAVAAAPGFTMADEYLPHALAAVRLLRAEADVDPERVFVLGHSMGGKVAPRVAAAEPAVAGLVLLAADAAPMQQAAVRVARHLAALAPGPDADAAVALLERQAAQVDAPELSERTPGAELPFGYPGAFWLDLRGYDPVATAAGLDRPMLLLQGGRDYQVTVADDLARWRTGLDGRPEVTIRVHEALNHYFVSGDGPSAPAEYAVPGHVEEAVVQEVADWIGAPARLNRL